MPEIRSVHWDSVPACTVGTTQAEHEIVTRQREDGVSQDGWPPIVYRTTTQMWDVSATYVDTPRRDLIPLIPIADRGGVLQDGYESGQRNYRDESSTVKPQGVESVHGGHVPQGNERQCDVLTYPSGVVDAVTITDRDMESLQAERWLRGNIIDFYIRYLQRDRFSCVKDDVYFFNSFFFTKLVESTAQGKSGYEQVRKWTGDVNLFEKKYIFIPVNQSSHWSLIIICHLSEDLASSSHDPFSQPYILHLDSLRDQHDCVGTHIRNYIFEAWKEKSRISSIRIHKPEVPQQDNDYDCGIFLLHYVERFLHWASMGSTLSTNSKLPKFLEGVWFESTEVSFKRKYIHHLIISLSEVPRTCLGDKALLEDGTEFVQDKSIAFVPNKDIAFVHDEDIEFVQYIDAESDTVKPAHDQTVVELTVHNPEGLPFTSFSSLKKDKRKRNSNWTKEETSILVKCKKEAVVDNGSRFCKGKPDVANWNAIAEEIKSVLETMSSPKTGDQCRLRWDTLVKSYQRIKEHCRMSNKRFTELTRTERVELKLATTLSEDEWYEVIDKFCPPKSRKSKYQKLDNVVPNVDTLPWSLHNSPHSNSPMQFEIASFEARESCTEKAGAMQDTPGFRAMSDNFNPAAYDPPVQSGIGSLEPLESPGKEDGRVQVIPGWSVMNGDLNPAGFGSPVAIPIPDYEPRKSSRKQVAIPRFISMSQDLKSTILNLVQAWPTIGIDSEMEDVCRWLAIVQDRSPSETRSYVFKLLSRNLLTISSRNEGACKLKLPHLRMYKKFVKVVVRKDPDYDSHSRILRDSSMLSLESSSLPQRIRVLTLHECENLERVDLGMLPVLRSLSIMGCHGLKEVSGWENVSELGWLVISGCPSYDEYPRVQCLPSLKEFSLDLTHDSDCDHSTTYKLDFSQCVRLRSLKIYNDDRLTESGDLSSLKCLEELNFSGCSALGSIGGFSELHVLTKVKFSYIALKGLPDLGHLKALAELKIDCSSVETIPGFENLHSLTRLALGSCSALKILPDLGHLKALAELDISCSSVETIPGFENLHSLTRLALGSCSALKILPDLGHLKALANLDIRCSSVETIPGFENLHSLTRLALGSCSALRILPDLGHLKALANLDIRCSSVETIPGFENLRSLTQLILLDCNSLKSLPDLGHLKALANLDIRCSSVETIPGFENLHSLTRLYLRSCEALKRLPYVGHLKALAHMDIDGSGVDEIPGVRELVSLKTLTCSWSKLEWLPDLADLPRLMWVIPFGTPLVKVPSSKYFGKSFVMFNERVKGAEEVRDPDYVPSDQEYFDDCEAYDSSDTSSDG